MANVEKQVLLLLVVLTMISNNEGSAPFFLQAITSALGTIPFTAGPMTTGLVGAKLAVGSKLLYYLGFFGRRTPKSRPKPARSAPSKQRFSGAQFPGGMQAVPLPYAFGAGAQQFGGFPQQFGGGFGGGNPNAFSQYPYGYDPAQLFQMLAAQGIDPATAMQAMGGGGQSVPSSQFPFPSGGNPGLSMPTAGSQGFPQEIRDKSPSSSSASDSSSEGSDNDVESFFTFLRDMDDNTCISRLMCDIGADPSFLGEFSENIHGIIGSLDVVPSSGAFQYISIMESGKTQGGCGKKFPQCGDAAYEIVKNVAPSVGMPSNINSETVNQL